MKLHCLLSTCGRESQGTTRRQTTRANTEHRSVFRNIRYVTHWVNSILLISSRQTFRSSGLKESYRTWMAVFWVAEPCSLVEVYQRFRGSCCLHHQGDETLVNVYQTARRYNPEDSHLRIHRRENLKSYRTSLTSNIIYFSCHNLNPFNSKQRHSFIISFPASKDLQGINYSF
jgi:hypothetical protein